MEKFCTALLYFAIVILISAIYLIANQSLDSLIAGIGLFVFSYFLGASSINDKLDKMKQKDKNQ